MTDYRRTSLGPRSATAWRVNVPCDVNQSRRHARADRSRRSWSSREEGFMLGTLKELVAQGWKTENGFKPGYLVKLDDAMRREFPGTDIRISPHIQSKIHTWKKSYGALSQILARSGVGFNLHGDHKIDCEEAMWKDILKANAGLCFLRNKSWPYFEDWKIVFGKDRASGDGGVDMREAFNQTDPQPSDGNLGGPSEYHDGTNEFFGEDAINDDVSPDVGSDSVFSTTISSQAGSGAKKKRKVGDTLDGLVEAITRMHEATDARLEYLASRFGHESDVSKARNEVFQLVGVIPELTLLQVFDASEYILSKAKDLDFFTSLPDVARQTYVFRALDKLGGN